MLRIHVSIFTILLLFEVSLTFFYHCYFGELEACVAILLFVRGDRINPIKYHLKEVKQCHYSNYRRTWSCLQTEIADHLGTEFYCKNFHKHKRRCYSE